MNVHYIQLDAVDAFSFMEEFAEQRDIAIVHSETVAAFEQKSRLYPPDFIVLNAHEHDAERVSDALAGLNRLTPAPVVLLANGDEGRLDHFTESGELLGIMPPTKPGYEKLSRLLSVVKLVGFDPLI